MLFHSKGKRLNEQIIFEDKTIKNSHETKFLGIWLNDNLSWESHIRQLTIKIKRNIILLRKSKNFLRKNAMLPIYYGHIHSHLKYGILLWGSMINQSQFARIQKMQDTAVKLIDNNKDIEATYSKHGILKLKRVLTVEQQKFAYRLINNLLPVNLSKLAKSNHKGTTLHKTHAYNMRSKTEPNLPPTKSHHYHNSFLHQSIKAFGTLPLEIKNKTNLFVFSRSIKHLTNTF